MCVTSIVHDKFNFDGTQWNNSGRKPRRIKKLQH